VVRYCKLNIHQSQELKQNILSCLPCILDCEIEFCSRHKSVLLTKHVGAHGSALIEVLMLPVAGSSPDAVIGFFFFN
jgi:hypothetical protein